MPTKLEPPCKGCEQRNERCHIKCEKYGTYCKDMKEFREYEKENNDRLNSIIGALESSNCRQRSYWR